MKYSFIVLMLVLLSSSQIYSQTIKGKILDETTSEPLIGATVKIEGTKLGAITDIDGTYEISDVKSGKYNLIISYIGYSDKVIKGVEVIDSKNISLDVVLQPSNLTTEEIIVESDYTLSNEKAILTEQKNSNKVTDGISNQQIKKAPDASASEVLKRVTGLSIIKDKFVFVRGTSERYNNTTLNGALIPSTEPDKKSFSFDLFPSNLLENIIISKTFTPDQPGNFSGGLVQITTKEFPESFMLNFTASSSFTGNTTGKDFFQYNAGETKFLFMNLGMDNGSRELPSVIPGTPLKNNNFSPEQLSAYSQAFGNDWQQTSKKAPLNSSFQLSVGNAFNVGKIQFGVLGAFSYKNSFSNKSVERNLFNTDNTQISGFNGRSSEYSVLWGGLINLNAKINEHNKISLKSTFVQTGEDETEYYEGFYSPEQYDRNLYITRFSQRSLSSYQLIGNHYLFNRINFDWRASYSISNRVEPDVKTMTYQRETGSGSDFYAALNYNVGNDFAGGRFFSNLKDINKSIQADIEIPIKFNLPLIGITASSKVKTGVFLNGTNRNFSARNFGPALYINAPFNLIYEPIESIFKTENFTPGKMFYDELSKESDKYSASDNLYAGYVMIDIPFEKLRFIVGGRFEYGEQKVNTLGIISEPINNRLIDRDILPSINLIYKATESSNLRLAYSQTVSRPELREIAPFSYVDFVSGILVYGNAVDLKRSLVRNYDIRYEIFPNAGEIVSLSLFYKHFDAPIEDVFISTSTNKIKSFKNADNGANNFGFEAEVRKNLSFISTKLKDFGFSGNLTLIHSSVNLEGVSTTATEKQRRMQGQSPYMINAGLYYENYDAGLNVNLVYNRFGDRISEVGLNGFSDVYEKGNDLIDISISKTIYSNLELRFAVKDVLNADKIFTQEVEGVSKIVRRINTGQTYLFSVTYRY